MSNFVNDLDDIYRQKKRERIDANIDNNFYIYVPVFIKTEVFSNENYLIRKDKNIKFLYIKDGCRVYFSDADIINMLLKVENRESIGKLVSYFNKMYQQKVEGLETYSIIFGDERYSVKGCFEIKNTQILLNRQDIDITFNDLLVLINLILAKDYYAFNSNRYSEHKNNNFLKTTCVKYISLLQYYYFEDEKAKLYLENNGYKTNEDIDYNYRRFRQKIKRNKIFQNFKEFEKYNNLC